MMTHPNPAISALKGELSKAIRRDHRRRERRRKILLTGGLSVLALGLLSTAALAIGGALDEVEVRPGVSAEAVSIYPEFNAAAPSGFVTSSAGGKLGSYVYHVTGGEARELGCGPTDPHPTDNIYITSTRPLSAQEIRGMLEPDGQLVPLQRPPAGVTGTSDGCPTPGVGGQPGSPSSPAMPGKAGVQVAPSTTTSAPPALPSNP